MSIVCYNSDHNLLEHYFQWDKDQTVTIAGLELPPIPVFHICNRLSEEAYVMEGNVVGTEMQVDIPNYLFTQCETIMIYVYAPTPEGGYRTTHAIMIPVIPRPKPDDYVYEDNVNYISVAMVDARVTELINSLSSGATGDVAAEVVDIRTSFDGTTYDTAGDAVRSIVPQVTGIAEFAGANAAREVVPDLVKAEALRLVDPAYIKPTVTGTGSVSFADGSNNVPMVSCAVTFDPQQDLNGQGYPYMGGAGRNLFNYDGARVVAAKVNTSQERLRADSGRRSVVFRCEAGETYTVSCASSMAGIQVGTCADNPQVDETSFNVTASGDRTGTTITAAASDTYLVATIYNFSTDSVTPEEAVAQTQIEKGTTATSFAPYENICPISTETSASVKIRNANRTQSSTFVANFPEDAGVVHGATMEMVSGLLTKDWEHVLLDGTSSGGKIDNTFTSSGLRVGRMILPVVLPGIETTDPHPREYLLCDKMKSSASYAIGTIKVSVIYIQGVMNTAIDIVLPDQSLTTASAMNTWLASNNITVAYKVDEGLADEFETAPHEIDTFYGANTIEVIDPDYATLSATYRADTGLYIQNM